MSIPRTPPVDPLDNAVAGPEGPMSEKQAAHLRDLCDKLDEPFDVSLTHEQAQRRIEALQKRVDQQS